MRRKKFINYIMRKVPHLILLITLFAVSLLIGSYLPQNIPLHWDRDGIVDRIGTKYELIFLFPCAAAIIFAAGIFMESRFVLPTHKLRGFITFMQFFFLVIFFVLQVRGLLRAENIWVPIERLMTIPILMLFLYVSVMFNDAEYLSLFGIKTKWTLESKAVWEKTNRLASRLFKISTALMLIPIYYYRLFYILLAIPPTVSFVAAAVYSKVIAEKDDEE